MASIGKMQTTKDGRRYWLIRVSMGKGKSYRKTRYYWQDGHSEKTALNKLNKFACEFERQCKAGAVLSRKEKAEQEAARKAEMLKLKTVRQYAESVFMPSKEITVTENTRANYQQFLDRHILPVIGDYLLSDITPAMLTKLLLDYQKSGKSHASAIKLYNILNGIFEMAFLDDSIVVSPMLKVKRPAPNKDATTKPEAEKALTVQTMKYVFESVDKEYQQALKAFEFGRDQGRKGIYSALLWKAYIELSTDTGARRGEMCGLKWSDIDWDKKTVTISRNLQYTPQKGVYEASPKNGKERTVDLGDAVIATLKALLAEQSALHLSKWIFSQEGTGDPMHPQSPTRYFKKFGERYGIEDFHPHLLRHTSASVAITHGADIVSVSQRLGHSDTAVTLRMYAHANEESIRAAGQAVRDAINAKQAATT